MKKKEVSSERHLTEKLHLNHFADIGTECIKAIIEVQGYEQ